MRGTGNRWGWLVGVGGALGLLLATAATPETAAARSVMVGPQGSQSQGAPGAVGQWRSGDDGRRSADWSGGDHGRRDWGHRGDRFFGKGHHGHHGKHDGHHRHSRFDHQHHHDGWWGAPPARVWVPAQWIWDGWRWVWVSGHWR